MGKITYQSKGRTPQLGMFQKNSVSRKQKSFHVTINKPPQIILLRRAGDLSLYPFEHEAEVLSRKAAFAGSCKTVKKIR